MMAFIFSGVHFGKVKKNHLDSIKVFAKKEKAIKGKELIGQVV